MSSSVICISKHLSFSLWINQISWQSRSKCAEWIFSRQTSWINTSNNEAPRKKKIQRLGHITQEMWYYPECLHCKGVIYLDWKASCFTLLKTGNVSVSFITPGSLRGQYKLQRQYQVLLITNLCMTFTDTAKVIWSLCIKLFGLRFSKIQALQSNEQSYLQSLSQY